MNIPLRGALTLGDAVLSTDADFYLGEPIIEAANFREGSELDRAHFRPDCGMVAVPSSNARDCNHRVPTTDQGASSRVRIAYRT